MTDNNQIVNKENLHKTFLQWENFTVKRETDKAVILKDISGRINEKESLAILGGSGAGKTTFLNYLSQKCSKNGLIKESGESTLIINNRNETASFTFLSSYVTQDDILLNYMTPKELLLFAANLRLPSKSNIEKEILVSKLITDLELIKCQDTQVGTVEKKGLSGGERKRTAIGYELITNPKILFLDEPTTGLDIINARNVVEIITSEAKANNRIVIFTIHQPSTEIFYLFDKLMIMASGHNVYFGEAANAVNHFEKNGFHCLSTMNPAEFFISSISQENIRYKIKRKNTMDRKNSKYSKTSIHDKMNSGNIIENNDKNNDYEESKSMISTDYLNLSQLSLNDLEELEDESKIMPSELDNNNINKDNKNWYINEIEKLRIKTNKIKDNKEHISNINTEEGEVINLIDTSEYPVNKYSLHREENSFFKEFLIMFHRHFLGIKRDPKNMMLRLAMIIVNSLFVILMFWRLPKGDTAYLDRTACVFYITNICVSINMQVNILIMLSEKLYFFKETDNNLYRCSTYLISKSILEVPIQVFFSIITFLIVYFASGLNTVSFIKYINFIYIYALSGLTSSFFSIILSILIDSLEVAPAVMPFFMLTQALSGGYYIKLKSLPDYFKPFYYISIYRFTFQALTYNEFTDLPEMNCHDPIKCMNPLDEFTDTYLDSVLYLLIYSVANILICYVVLKIKVYLRKKNNK